MRDVIGRMEGTGLENRCAADKSFITFSPTVRQAGTGLPLFA